MLDVRRLRALREVALKGSFSEAAAALNYTQSAISQQVAQLERQVGVVLVERRGRRIELTPAGRDVVRHTEVILQHLQQAEIELEVAAGVRRGTVRIAASASSVVTWLPAAMHRFQRRCPEAALSLAVSDARTAVAGVADGQADLAVFSHPVTAVEAAGAGTSPVVVIDLVGDALCLALPVTHRFARRPEVDLIDLADERWVVARGGDSEWEQVVTACEKVGFRPRVAFTTDDYLAAQSLVAAGLGVAAVSTLVAAASPRGDLTLRRTSDDTLVQAVSVAVRAGHEQHLAALIEVLRSGAVACSLEAEDVRSRSGGSGPRPSNRHHAVSVR